MNKNIENFSMFLQARKHLRKVLEDAQRYLREKSGQGDLQAIVALGWCLPVWAWYHQYLMVHAAIYDWAPDCNEMQRDMLNDCLKFTHLLEEYREKEKVHEKAELIRNEFMKLGRRRIRILRTNISRDFPPYVTRLDQCTDPIREIRGSERVAGDHCYVVPGTLAVDLPVYEAVCGKDEDAGGEPDCKDEIELSDKHMAIIARVCNARLSRVKRELPDQLEAPLQAQAFMLHSQERLDGNAHLLRMVLENQINEAEQEYRSEEVPGDDGVAGAA